MKNFLRTTLMGGVVFMIPLVIVFVVLAKAFSMTKKLVGPLNTFIPTDSIVGIAMIDVLTVFAMLCLCFAGDVGRSRGRGGSGYGIQ